jgi:hypothetical protein
MTQMSVSVLYLEVRAWSQFTVIDINYHFTSLLQVSTRAEIITSISGICFNIPVSS